MATIKIKFRRSATTGKEGSVYYQIIHNRIARQVKTGYRMYESEWNVFIKPNEQRDTHFDAATARKGRMKSISNLSKIKMPRLDETRKAYLLEIRERVASDTQILQRIMVSLEQQGNPFTPDDVVSAFVSLNSPNSFFAFMEEVIANLQKLGKVRTSEAYTTTLSSFRRFRDEKDVLPNKIDSDMMLAYEAYLRTNGVSPNSSSFYMRNLRAVYNRAVEKELTTQRFPFKHVYTGVEKTVKRAVPLKVIKKIKEIDLSLHPATEFARDMFMFSFYTRGMSLVDMAYLRKKDLSGGVLSYRRRKTGQQLLIKWEKPMQEIVDKYNTSESIYLLPLIKQSSNIEERLQYIYAGHNINRSLKFISQELELSLPLTMYCARHSWASIAKSKNIPLSVISEGMGHDSENTTRIYLASLDNIAIDKANSLILNSL